MNKKKYSEPRYIGQDSKRKFKGFGFYIMSNDKLSKKNREKLLIESEIHLGDVIHSLKGTQDDLIGIGVLSELDNSLSDIELLDQWNYMYDNYGYLMVNFKERWEKEQIKGYHQTPLKQSKKFEELNQRVTELEIEVMKLKVEFMKSKKPNFDY
jgi:hypothetical protein